MKLLQVCNVATVLGGTGACVWTITRCLPDWQHHVIAVNSGDRAVDEKTRELFGCHVECKPKIIPAHMDKIRPDVILFHNTSEANMPHIPDGCIPFYYQHSGSRQAEGARNRCAVYWVVSKYLADLAGIDHRFVWYQPVPKPALQLEGSRGDVIRIGRLCKPESRKWSYLGMLPLYQRLALEYPQVVWEFVGCPPGLSESPRDACQGRAEFHGPSWERRSILWTWHAMLYDNTSVAETYGRTVCESQRAGCVPIVNKLGGFIEQINHRGDGYLCEDVDDFDDAVCNICDPVVWPVISENAMVSGDDRGSLKNWRRGFLAWLKATKEFV